MSFTGSARRLWGPVRRSSSGTVKVLLGVLMATVIVLVWAGVAGWYLVFGLLVVPWRVLRRGQRRKKREDALARQTGIRGR